ncbi:hypothetical protein [uncultured Thiohalocapsa sp.]|uniref:hypothetical protein n=1 Tax=uncultured Thiohalocapsa sp. TaxID=768990 RepID=UPI0025F4B185|nr:hypothetical protein [uncultured Thiohalocapsa sp.]
MLLLDELAQHAAWLAAAYPQGSGQLSAFLMALNGYARTHAGIAVVLTLASRTDAFASQTEELARTLTEVRGEDVTPDEAAAMAQSAHAESSHRISSVYTRPPASRAVRRWRASCTSPSHTAYWLGLAQPTRTRQTHEG